MKRRMKSPMRLLHGRRPAGILEETVARSLLQGGRGRRGAQSRKEAKGRKKRSKEQERSKEQKGSTEQGGNSMNLRIGENIRRLRRERNLTQEEVAAHLGISFQSVSKWERCDGYPDITMLPALAHYFGVSVDALIGMDQMAKAEKYDEVNRLWKENNRRGRHQENVVLMRDSLRTFPNDGLLLVQLSTSLEKLDGTKEEKAKYLRESIALQEQILRYGEDSQVRSATQYNICFSYWKNGEQKKALEQARKLPNLYKARENALVFFLEGEERHETAKAALEPLAWSAELHLSILAEALGEPAYLEKAREIRRLLLGHGEEDSAGPVQERRQNEPRDEKRG